MKLLTFFAACFLVANSTNVMPRIISQDTASSIENFNYIVYVLKFFSSKSFGHCGGSIIGTKSVLTAAHCFKNMTEVVGITVTAGSPIFRSNTQGAQTRNVKDVTIHPNYTYWKSRKPLKSRSYDIAVLTLDREFDWTEKVNPIKMATSQDDVRGDATISGWGAEDVFNLKQSPRLKYANITIKDPNDCHKLHPGLSDNPNKLLCSIDFSKGMCRGDSGGPVVKFYNNTNLLIGVLASTYNSLGIINGIDRSVYCGIGANFYVSVGYHNEYIRKYMAQEIIP